MKILLVAPNYPPEFTGGTERVVELLANDLTGMGHDVSVFCGSRRREGDGEIEVGERDGLKIYRYVRHGIYEDVIDGFDAMCEEHFDAALAEFRPDVIHLHHWANLSNGLVAVAARRGIPSVVSLHDFYTTCSRFFRLPAGPAFCEEVESTEACVPCNTTEDPIERDEKTTAFVMRRKALEQELELAAAHLVPGDRHRELLARFGSMASERVDGFITVPPGTPVTGRVELGDDDEERLVVAHWGNLGEIKGIHVLTRAASRAACADRITLRFFGRSLDELAVEELSKEAAPAKVELGGEYAPEELAGRLDGAHVACFPSLAHETHSMVVDEALILGLPVIVSDRGAMPLRIGGRGLVVAGDDVEELARALDAMADPAARKTCRDAESGEVMTNQEHARRCEAVYGRILADPPVLPDRIPDHGRERHHRNMARNSDIRQFVDGMWSFADDLELALGGDEASLARIAKKRPELADRIGRMLSPGETS